MEFNDKELSMEFKAESLEHLAAIEGDLLTLEENPAQADKELVDRIFRAIHTVKGSAGFLGWHKVGALSHVMETLLDRLRKGQMPAATVVGELLGGIDDLRKMVGDLFNSEAHHIDARVARLEALLERPPPPVPVPASLAVADEVKPYSMWSAAPSACRHHFHLLLPDMRAWQNAGGMTPLALFKRLEEHGFVAESLLDMPVSGLSGNTLDKPVSLGVFYATALDKDELAALLSIPAACIAELKEGEAATHGKSPALNHFRIVFNPHKDLAEVPRALELLWDDLRGLGECDFKELETEEDAEGPEWRIDVETAAEENAVKDVFMFVEGSCQLTIEKLEQRQKPVLEEEEGPTAELANVPANVMETETAALAAEGKRHAMAESLRVPSEKLDQLVNLVGELVILQAQLTAAAEVEGATLGLRSAVESFQSLSAELRDIVLNIRMTPIGNTFNKYRRLIRDLSQEFGKDVELIIEGAETEMDKSVIDQLGDPLLHLVRNSMDHGFETIAERATSGKPAKGTLRLSARQQGDNVVIAIEDDGRGLNVEAIRAKAVERGLLQADASVSDYELHQMIFQPGFSTARTVSSVSGRGVGMDVVKRQVEALRGSIDMTSEPGKGTTISLSLPLTLAIIEGLMVEVDREFFIVPLSLVRETIELTRAQRLDDNGRNVVDVRGALVPYLRLREVFDFPEADPDLERVVIVELEGGKLGLVVDRVVGNHQTVLKALGRLYREVTIFSGATILGDGTVALILDISGLLRHAKNKWHLSEGFEV